AEMEGMKESLMKEGSTPMELLLIEAILICWLRVQHAEFYRTQLINEAQSYTQYEFAEKMLTNAHNRYIKAIESLAKLRKLKQPKRSDLFDRSLRVIRPEGAIPALETSSAVV